MITPKVKKDGRVRLSPEQKEEIYRKYHDPLYPTSQRILAKEYGVSRRLIGFVVHPERLQALKDKQRANQHWKTYYDRQKLTLAMRKWRNKLKSDPETKKVFLEYTHAYKAKSWAKKQPQPCPHCGKTLKALRDHIRRIHE